LLNNSWHGILIEANPQRIPFIKNGFKGLNITILNLAVSLDTTPATLYINTVGGNDSLLPTWHEATKTKETITVPSTPLPLILEPHSIPVDFDLLSIDIEGMDRLVIQHLFQTSLYRPKIIITEVDSYPEPLSFFSHYGYTLLQLAGNPLDGNLILERKFCFKKPTT